MAYESFDQYLQDALLVAKQIRDARDAAEAILARHNAQAMGDVTDFVGRPVTEAQYDGLITTFGNLTGAWWGSPGFNGSNIEAALTEKPS